MPKAAFRPIALDSPDIPSSVATAAMGGNQVNLSSAIPSPLENFLPEPPTAEELQFVQRIFFLSGNEMPRVVVFSGVQPGDGSELVCARTAEVLSTQVSETVCIIDADVRAPSLHTRYEINLAGGFNGESEEDGEGSVLRTREPNLWILSADALQDARSGLSLHSMNSCLSKLRQEFGFLLISAPPLSTGAEGFLFGQMTDGVVLTVLARWTHRAVAKRVRHNLELCNVPILGVAMQEAPPKVAWERIRLLAFRTLHLREN